MQLTLEKSLEMYKNGEQNKVSHYTERALNAHQEMLITCHEEAGSNTVDEIADIIESELEDMKHWLKAQEDWEDKHFALSDAMEEVWA